MIKDSVLETIGDTPLVRLQHLASRNGSDVLVKLEGFNPGGSIKDRAAWRIIRSAERSGALRRGATIVESTSGNFGKALALIGAACGYRVVLIVDPKAPNSMLRYVRALGAEIEMVDRPDRSGGYQIPRIERLRALMATIPGAFCPDQYANPENPRAHAEETAREIADEVLRVDVLVAAVSTGGHLSGLADGLRRRFPDLRTVAVEPVGSSAFGFPPGPYAMRGLGLAWTPDNLDVPAVDELHRVEDREGLAMCRLLARREGILVGESSGAVVFAALHVARRRPGSTVVAVLADTGTNYLDESFDDAWLRSRGLAETVESTRQALGTGAWPAPTHAPVQLHPTGALLDRAPGPVHTRGRDFV